MSFVICILPFLALICFLDVGTFQLLHGLPYLTHWYPPVSTNRLPLLSHLTWRPVLDPKSPYGVVARGTPETASYRLYFWDVEGPISPFHDIPIYANEEETILNLVIEIPRWTNAKMEISNEELLNPIKQDFKNGDLRFAKNIFPYHGYLWNYGAFPQSWENPNSADSVTGFRGDNDPLDVLEIGTRVGKTGDVVRVKVLGALGLIDEGETDWKIFAIDVNDVLANRINDVCDIEEHFPGLIEASIEWLKTYKIPDGKPENMFALDGKVQNKQFAESVVRKTHEHWRSLIMNPETESNHSRVSVTRIDSPFSMPRVTALNLVAMSTAMNDNSLPLVRHDDVWYFHPSKDTSNCSSDSTDATGS